VSLLPRNELRLRLGPRHGAAIDERLAALAEAGRALPRRASVCAEDEYVYYATLPAPAHWKQAREAAGEHFSALLGEHDLLVDATLAPCGTRWIAAAVDAALVQGWRESLAAHGVALQGLRTALLEDLWTLRARIALADGVLALVRSEGVSLVALAGGAVRDLAWERCEVDDLEVLAERIASGAAELFAGDDNTQPVPVCLVPSAQGDLQALRELCARRGWTLDEGLRSVAPDVA